MAQGKVREAGAPVDVQGCGVPLPGPAAAAYGRETGACRLVLLAKPLPSGAGHYPPFAVVRLEDLPEELRRQVGGGGGGQAAAATGPGSPGAAAAPALRGEGAAPARHVVPEHLARQLAGLLVSRPNDGSPTAELTADDVSGAFGGNSCRRVPDMALRSAAGAETGAFYDGGLPAPIFALLLDDDSHSDGLVFPGADNAVPLLHGGNLAAEDGAHYYCCNSDVLVPSPEDLKPTGEATRSSTYAVQVWVDAAAGAKAGDPIAAGVKADAGHEHGNLAAMAGIIAASSSATALAAGAVGPVTALGLFAVLVGGLSLAMASVRAL